MQCASPSGTADPDPGFGTIEIARVTDPDDLDDARRLRQAMYTRRYPFDLSEQDDSRRDEEGYVFLARTGGVPVGTVRLLPLTSSASELKILGLLPPDLVPEDVTVAEGGRLAARPRPGPGPSYGLLMQVWSAEWLRHHTALQRWVAWCRKDVLPIHQRIGANILGGPFPVPALGPGEFFVVGSSFEALVEHAVMKGCGSIARLARSSVDGRALVEDDRECVPR